MKEGQKLSGPEQGLGIEKFKGKGYAGKGFESAASLALDVLIDENNDKVDADFLLQARKSGEIGPIEYGALLFQLSKRNEKLLKEAQDILGRNGLIDRRAKPRMPGEKRHIEVSKDGTQKFS